MAKTRYLTHAAAEHERRTGMRTNMRALGWRLFGTTTIDGRPSAFVRGTVGSAEWWQVRTNRQGRWYCRRLSKVGNYPTNRKLTGPDFDGPVAAALWLQVEIANDTVRFD